MSLTIRCERCHKPIGSGVACVIYEAPKTRWVYYHFECHQEKLAFEGKLPKQPRKPM